MFRNGLEPWHLLIVAAVIILLFGAKKLPDLARGLGKSMRILKSETKAMKDENNAPAASDDTHAEPAARFIDSPRGEPEAARAATESREAR
ncbi:Sec-independent protein translocase subunit TatA [Streptomyces sp. J2-1]|uniref:Sec-independent protein translocase subunit TatA n=1 Tax=Streptomyces corallincola TaxID=2851888 RepID=UPI001C393812|nr:Sec-independent protein translocase subunit TatA [Streptomyces corallincola]MBV2354132.1 Sec-independent protein translocase subunit TatA [Streptomyces corallincola]